MTRRFFSKTFYRIHIDGANTCIAPDATTTRGFEKTQTTASAHRHYSTVEQTTHTVSRTAQKTIKAHAAHDDLVKPMVCYRGDSRFPWKTWATGGVWAKGKGSEKFSVQLHQSCPEARQDVVSTSTNPETGRKYAIAPGLMDDRYYPTLEQFDHVDQSNMTWVTDQGYNNALWVEGGISLKQVNRSEQAYSHNARVQQRYKWEDEIAVLGGIPRTHTLAMRETKAIGEGIHKEATHQSIAYIDRRLMLGKATELGNSDEVLATVFKELFELDSDTGIAAQKNILTQIQESAATAIQRAWRHHRNTAQSST